MTSYRDFKYDALSVLRERGLNYELAVTRQPYIESDVALCDYIHMCGVSRFQ